jgi:hypothetical protein
VLVPGKPGQSPLYAKVAAGEMPPGKPLPAEQVAALKQWIAAGAPYEGEPLYAAQNALTSAWWSLEPLTSPAVPRTRFDALAHNPIDRFVFAQLERQKLAPSPPADRRTLLRRVTFDLTGLPPTPAAVSAFLADQSPDAYEKVVDRLLASPAYGERWGRHWLDIVRYGESNGYEQNHVRPNAWPYRDYVIHSWNADKPYPQFVAEQLAADALARGDAEIEAATGFLVAGVHDTVGNQTEEGTRQQRANDLDDMVATIGAAFLGLSVHCARCHDHKFDPIPQADYYRLAAVVAGVRHGERPLSAKAVAPAAARTAYIGQLTAPEPIFLLKRGDVMQRSEPMSPGALSRLPGLSPELAVDPRLGEAGRRLALARWITDPKNPLTARVLVNRLWQYHFERGMVGTPSDFGRNGEPPSHPELLDWLARDLVAGGWQLKRLHRLMVTSYTYRQASGANDAGLAGDAGNRLLWRMPLRRLEAEVVRDAILAVSGNLDRRMSGPGYRLFKYHVVNVGIYEPLEDQGPPTWRRGVYQQAARAVRDNLLASFDCPECAQRAPRRDVTTTPLQALSLLNGPFAVRQAEAFARRLEREAGTRPEAQVDRAFRLAFGRPPADSERAAARELVAHRGLAALCRALFNANEFLYY